MALLEKVKAMFTTDKPEEIKVLQEEVKAEVRVNKEELSLLAKELYLLWQKLEAFVEGTPNKIDDKLLGIIDEDKLIDTIEKLVDLIPAIKTAINIALKFPWIISLLRKL